MPRLAVDTTEQDEYLCTSTFDVCEQCSGMLLEVDGNEDFKAHVEGTVIWPYNDEDADLIIGFVETGSEIPYIDDTEYTCDCCGCELKSHNYYPKG